MDEVEEMMESLAIDDESSLNNYDHYVDFTYEFDASKFFDFSMDETSYEVREAEGWFRFAREYPPARKSHTFMITCYSVRYIVY